MYRIFNLHLLRRYNKINYYSKKLPKLTYSNREYKIKLSIR